MNTVTKHNTRTYARNLAKKANALLNEAGIKAVKVSAASKKVDGFWNTSLVFKTGTLSLNK